MCTGDLVTVTRPLPEFLLFLDSTKQQNANAAIRPARAGDVTDRGRGVNRQWP